jgi:tetratricopeptide (TPR) repeat protein
MFELKRLSRDAVPAALEKAHRYRLLNEPLEAESICRDILEVDAENQEALVTLLLALTDQFDDHLAKVIEPARETLTRLRDEYSRLYYTGILCERRAKSHLKRGGPRAAESAYGWFREAMESYEKAIEIRPPANDDALLRWNTCARVLMANPKLAPEAEEEFQTWLE